MAPTVFVSHALLICREREREWSLMGCLLATTLLFVCIRYTMACPDGCAPAVHEQVMRPCWRTDPKTRPSFAALMETLVSLGAVPPQVTQLATSARARRRASDERQEASKSACDDVRELLGPSVHHITTKFTPRVIEAVRPPWTDKHGRRVDPPESATIAHAVQAVVRPHSATKISPHDGAKGAAYVDTLIAKDDVGLATALLSCESVPFVSLLHLPAGRGPRALVLIFLPRPTQRSSTLAVDVADGL